MNTNQVEAGGKTWTDKEYCDNAWGWIQKCNAFQDEILSLKQQLKEKQGWSDEDMWQLYCDLRTNPNRAYFKDLLAEYKSKTNR